MKLVDYHSNDNRTIQCTCCSDHTLTLTPVFYPEVIDINGIVRLDYYTPLCRSCYLKYKNDTVSMVKSCQLVAETITELKDVVNC